MKYNSDIYINGREISINSPTYFIADLASNHDGDIERAESLIRLAKNAGADAVKFQHFKADEIVSEKGFKNLGTKIGHQARWKKSVFEIYKQYECSMEWTEKLAQVAKEVKIDFLTTPYDCDVLELLDPYLPAYKIGSGDITWHDFIEEIARKGKPVFLASGAANMEEVENAMEKILKHNKQVVLMQCNTNYTGSKDNFKYINLRVLSTFSLKYPQMLLGLSDHSSKHAAVLGAIALGARVVEKHFTDDNDRDGPDHSFSLNPFSWKEMIERSRELELALGDGVKRVEANEKEGAIIQQRSLYLARDLRAGEKIDRKSLKFLRPVFKGGFKPYELNNVIGKTLAVSKKSDLPLLKTDLKKVS